MGWKSTIDITRHEAIKLIMDRLLYATDRELCDAVTALNYGDNPDIAHYGKNFMITEPKQNQNDTDGN